MTLLFACQSQSSEATQTPDDTTTVEAAAAPAAEDEQQVELCFLEVVGQDSTIVNLGIVGSEVTGEMFWRPFEKDGATGTLKGKIVENTITADYAYTIEGSEQVEEKIFVLYEDRLVEKSGPLEDKNGKLVMKDPATATDGAVLKKVDCKL